MGARSAAPTSTSCGPRTAARDAPADPHPPHPHRRVRRGHHTAFWVLTAVVVSSLVVGLVSVNAMRVDAAYRSRSLAEEIRTMSGERRTLVNDVAHLSSPSRIGRWAVRQGLVHPAPGDVVILQVPGFASHVADGRGEGVRRPPPVDSSRCSARWCWHWRAWGPGWWSCRSEIIERSRRRAWTSGCICSTCRRSAARSWTGRGPARDHPGGSGRLRGPRYVTDPIGEAARIAKILDLQPRQVERLLRTPDSTFVYLGRQVDAEDAEKLESLGLPGIGFLDVPKRYYPAGALAPQVLGFVGVDATGLAGLEFEYQDILAGSPGTRTVELSADGLPIASGIEVVEPATCGRTLVTTLDREVSTWPRRRCSAR